MDRIVRRLFLSTLDVEPHSASPSPFSSIPKLGGGISMGSTRKSRIHSESRHIAPATSACHPRLELEPAHKLPPGHTSASPEHEGAIARVFLVAKRLMIRERPAITHDRTRRTSCGA